MDDVLRTKEVAKFLKVSEGFVRELIHQKKLKGYKLGNRGGFRILKQELETYLNTCANNNE